MEFRKSMNLLHTWAGVIIGALLFAVFWMGTLSVFDREIDQWMAPMTRLALPAKPSSFDALRPTYDDAVALKSPTWTVLRPSDRQPFIRVVYRGPKGIVNRYFNPMTGAELPNPETLAGTRFLYPFHYSLHIKVWNIGEWIVGAGAMAMLLLCISGVAFHRKIFTDFFTLRSKPSHTLAGVLGLPFHFVITLSGLTILFAVYFPSGWYSSYESRQAFNAEAMDNYSRPKANKLGTLASIDVISNEARDLWNGAEPWAVSVRYPGDRAAYVSFFQSFHGSIVRHSPAIHFDSATGALLHKNADIKPVLTAQRFLSGMHQIQFRHWTLRFIYFGLGLLGCALIFTGFLFWLEARRKRHAQQGRSGVRIVEGIAVGSTLGIIAATASFFVINRLLPLGTHFLGIERAALEIWTFYLVWIVTFAHAWLRPGSAWTEQCWVIAFLSFSAVGLNWITTGDHLVRSLSHNYLWPVGSVDIVLLFGGVVALAFVRWRRRAVLRADPVAQIMAS